MRIKNSNLIKIFSAAAIISACGVATAASAPAFHCPLPGVITLSANHIGANASLTANMPADLQGWVGTVMPEPKDGNYTIKFLAVTAGNVAGGVYCTYSVGSKSTVNMIPAENSDTYTFSLTDGKYDSTDINDGIIAQKNK